MRTRTTIAFFVVALILVAWMLIVERPADEARRVEDATSRDLYDIDFDRATSIRIVRPADTLALAMVDTHWDVVAPVRDLAYQGSVGRVLKVLSDAQIDRDLGPTDDLGPFGLAPPEINITILSPAGTMMSLDIGNFTVDKSSIYVRRSGEKNVLLASTSIRRACLYDVEDWRNRRVLNFDLSAVTEYTVETGSEAMRWRRRGDTWWTVQNGDSILGDTEAVEGILRRIRGLRVRRFPEASEYGDRFDFARLRVEVVKTAPAPAQRLSMLWSSTGYPFIRTEHDGRVVETDSAVVGVFDVNVWDLRDKRPLIFDPGSVKRVEISAVDTTASLVLRGTEWGSPNPSISRLDQGRVRVLLSSIASLRFESPPRDLPKPSRESVFRLVLYGSDANLIDEFSCYEGDAQDTWVSYSPSVGTTTVSADAVRRIVERLRLIRKADAP